MAIVVAPGATTPRTGGGQPGSRGSSLAGEGREPGRLPGAVLLWRDPVPGACLRRFLGDRGEGVAPELSGRRRARRVGAAFGSARGDRRGRLVPWCPLFGRRTGPYVPSGLGSSPRVSHRSSPEGRGSVLRGERHRLPRGSERLDGRASRTGAKHRRAHERIGGRLDRLGCGRGTDRRAGGSVA